MDYKVFLNTDVSQSDKQDEMSIDQPNVEIMESDIDTTVSSKQSASEFEIVESTSDSEYEVQT